MIHFNETINYVEILKVLKFELQIQLQGLRKHHYFKKIILKTTKSTGSFRTHFQIIEFQWIFKYVKSIF